VTLIPEIPTWLSLAVILGTLLVTTMASLTKSRRDRVATSAAVPGGPASAAPDDLSNAPTSSAELVGTPSSR
jgi:tellurite resistance protein TerC